MNIVFHGFIRSYGVEYSYGVPFHYIDLNRIVSEDGNIIQQRVYIDENSYIELEEFLSKFYKPISDIFELKKFEFSFYFSNWKENNIIDDTIYTISKIKSDALLILFKQCNISEDIIKEDVLLSYLVRIESALNCNNRLLYKILDRIKDN